MIELFFLAIAFLSTAKTSSINNVHYIVDEFNKSIKITHVNGVEVTVQIIPPHGELSTREFDSMHQFPGVATDLLLTGAPSDKAILHVLMKDGNLLRTTANRVFSNFHVYRHRMVYGQLYTFVTDDFGEAEKIYLGAPIFYNNKLVSVVTCRFDDYERGLVYFPVTGVRHDRLISGQLHFDDNIVKVTRLQPGMSVYGRNQLPYSLGVKQLAMSAYNNRQMYRDWPRTVFVYYNESDIIISLVEGEFEISRVRFQGPLVEPQHK
ncbi:P26 [Buzura suppressaria nucleopolyhedrovirus]|uniref:p26 n=1 Tax=Buzura suppressaria nuclear polyhedrosis virus TaxID=74320 RepID=W5VS05_NPVBS|nr:P26 [Buzura suppressaria nucleopolyhedrovirus]AHH82597.1 P26 [Buzura suppressaria nucleopolyhedrovirus]